jgi:Pentapeptide repeats (9 copies)
MSEALIGGRQLHPLGGSQPSAVSDALFQADRVDKQVFEGARFSNCTFANVSFRDASLLSCTFENCAFIDCYFRRSVIDSSRFLGCKFVTCDFPKTSFRQVTFVYPQFRDCSIPYDDVEASLPSEPNLRRQMADNLAREAEAAGATRDARSYRLQADRALERYLWNGATGADQWSRDHFPGLADRSLAAVRVIGRWANRFVWGYGERGWVLARNVAVLAVGVFPLLYYLLRHDLSQQNGGTVGTLSYFLLSFASLLNGAGFSGVEPTTGLARAVVGIEVAVGLAAIGLGVALLLRWITRR